MACDKYQVWPSLQKLDWNRIQPGTTKFCNKAHNTPATILLKQLKLIQFCGRLNSPECFVHFVAWLPLSAGKAVEPEGYLIMMIHIMWKLPGT